MKDVDTIRKILEISRRKDREYPLEKKVIKPKSTGKKVSKKQIHGRPIDFRGLRHVPINEMGVVYLFAIMAKD